MAKVKKPSPLACSAALIGDEQILQAGKQLESTLSHPNIQQTSQTLESNIENIKLPPQSVKRRGKDLGRINTLALPPLVRGTRSAVGNSKDIFSRKFNLNNFERPRSAGPFVPCHYSPDSALFPRAHLPHTMERPHSRLEERGFNPMSRNSPLLQFQTQDIEFEQVVIPGSPDALIHMPSPELEFSLPSTLAGASYHQSIERARNSHLTLPSIRSSSPTTTPTHIQRCKFRPY
jgi:hypothetical protein